LPHQEYISAGGHYRLMKSYYDRNNDLSPVAASDPQTWKPDGFSYRLALFAAQEPVGQFACGGVETEVDPPFGAGTTGDFCCAGPPTEFCFVGPPIALCARARSQQALPTTPSSMTKITAPLFIRAAFHAVPADQGLAQYTSMLGIGADLLGAIILTHGNPGGVISPHHSGGEGQG
jgi:hypothetical protein